MSVLQYFGLKQCNLAEGYDDLNLHVKQGLVASIFSAIDLSCSNLPTRSRSIMFACASWILSSGSVSALTMHRPIASQSAYPRVTYAEYSLCRRVRS